MFNYWLRSLSARLWLTNVAALAISLSLIAGVMVYSLNHFPPKIFRKNSDIRDTYGIAAGIHYDASGIPMGLTLDEQTAWTYEVLPTELMYRVLDSTGHIVLASRNAHAGLPWLAGDLNDAVEQVETASINGRPFDILTVKIRHQQASYFIQTATSVDFDKAILDLKVSPIPNLVRATVLIATIIFGLTLIFTMRRVLKPLREASNAAASITPRNLTARLSTKGVPSEIKPLIQAFNDALGRLEHGFAVQQKFLAAAAHELQTPLTLLRGQIELQPEIEAKELLYREIDLMARQVRQLLHLAEVSETQNFSFALVDIAEVANDVAVYLGRKAESGQVQLNLETTAAPAPLSADKSAVFILLKNLVENAINVSDPHGVVSVLVDERSIQIRDTGHGINPEYLPFLFDRFWRAPNATYDGAGLGLAICKEIAVTHGWRLTVTTLTPGTQFTIWFE